MILTENNFGVVILCPDLNTGGLRYTTNSIKSDFPSIKHVALVGDDANNIDMENLSKFCPTYKGRKTITSLIDNGMKLISAEWCLIVMSGAMVQYPIFKKYCRFADEQAVVFPVINRKYLFHEASINGILMKKSLYEEVGQFGDETNDLEEAKLIWAAKAIEKNFKFKALVGVRFT